MATTQYNQLSTYGIVITTVITIIVIVITITMTMTIRMLRNAVILFVILSFFFFFIFYDMPQIVAVPFDVCSSYVDAAVCGGMCVRMLRVVILIWH